MPLILFFLFVLIFLIRDLTGLFINDLSGSGLRYSPCSDLCFLFDLQLELLLEYPCQFALHIADREVTVFCGQIGDQRIRFMSDLVHLVTILVISRICALDPVDL